MKFCIKLEHSAVETIWMIQKVAAMGNWWLAISSPELVSSCISSCAEFFGKPPITLVAQLPYSPDLALCNFWLFPKLKSPLKGKRFQTIDEIQENMMGQLMAIVENYVRSHCAYFEGGWGVVVLCTMSLVSCIFFNECLYFS